MSTDKMIVRFRHPQPMRDGYDYDVWELDVAAVRALISREQARDTFIAIRAGWTEREYPPGFFELTIKSDYGTGIEDGPHGRMAAEVAMAYGALKPLFWSHDPKGTKNQFARVVAGLFCDRLVYINFDFADGTVAISNDRSNIHQVPAMKVND